MANTRVGGHESALVARFAGDSGDGVQLAGLQFARSSALSGADLMTLPEYPAEVRAPAGTTYGVSAYQIQFGPSEVVTPGDQADMLVAFNPAAYVTNVGFLKAGGTVIIDESTFNTRGFAKAGLDRSPIDDDANHRYSIIRADITQLTLNAVSEFSLGHKDAARSKNFWALGLSLWLADLPVTHAAAWIETRFAKDPPIAGANTAALRAGHAYGETMELASSRRVDLALAPIRDERARMVSGTEAIALGILTAGALAARPIHYCSYPITPASSMLHWLAKAKKGVTTFQAEDEMAAACAAIGASYAGGLGVTASSGPGLSLKTEALGLAVTAELPLLVIDVQRAGPSTGMPTKPEQSDFDLAVFGRHGEAPLPVYAPASPDDCFWIMIDAAKAALTAMTPVIILSDAYLANAVTEWVPPRAEDLPDLRADLAWPEQQDETFGPYSRNPDTLARPWLTPGMPGFAHRVGGLEKDAKTGAISSSPENHARMVALRAEKIARLAKHDLAKHDLAKHDHGATIRDGDESGDLLVIGWGSTWGSIRQAIAGLREAGHAVTHLHLRRLWPLPRDLGAIAPRFRRIVCVEMNDGQLTRALRATYLLPVEAITQVTGRPFRVDELEAAFAGYLKGQLP